MTGDDNKQHPDVSVYMRWYVKEYLAAVACLNAEERGAYSSLLAEMWQNHGWLPLNARKLARMAAVEDSRWPDVWDAIRGFFIVNEDVKTLTQKRIQKELAEAREGRKVRAAAGRAGGRAKAERASISSNARENPSNASPAPSNATFLLEQCSTLNPSSVIRKPKSKSFPADKPPSQYDIAIEAFGTAWAQRYGAAYSTTAADRSQLGRLLNSLEPDQAAQLPGMFERYVKDPDKLATERRHDLAFFCTQGFVNRYRVQIATVKPQTTAQAAALAAEAAIRAKYEGRQ